MTMIVANTMATTNNTTTHTAIVSNSGSVEAEGDSIGAGGTDARVDTAGTQLHHDIRCQDYKVRQNPQKSGILSQKKMGLT